MAGAGALRAGERVLLVDQKERRYLLRLREGAEFHTHAGIVAHDALIGAEEGTTVEGNTGRRFLVLVGAFLMGRRKGRKRSAVVEIRSR